MKTSAQNLKSCGFPATIKEKKGTGGGGILKEPSRRKAVVRQNDYWYFHQMKNVETEGKIGKGEKPEQFDNLSRWGALQKARRLLQQQAWAQRGGRSIPLKMETDAKLIDAKEPNSFGGE